MAEIKSTMDLIMEKTKHLTMNEEEKEGFRKKELAGKVKGLVQKFQDGMIKINRLGSEISLEKEKNQNLVDELLKDELIERLEPDGNNEKVYELFQALFGMEINPLKQAIVEFQKKISGEKGIKMDELRKKLAERGISGPAVVPNPALDASWNAFYETSESSCKGQLGVIVGSQTTDPQ